MRRAFLHAAETLSAPRSLLGCNHKLYKHKYELMRNDSVTIINDIIPSKRDKRKGPAAVNNHRKLRDMTQGG